VIEAQSDLDLAEALGWDVVVVATGAEAVVDASGALVGAETVASLVLQPIQTTAMATPHHRADRRLIRS
jgi:hypothetical protein